MEVLKGVDHEAFRFKFILVECRDFTKLSAYLENKGYRFVEKLSSQDYLFTSDELSKSGACDG
ncbi:MAG: hypothetical protein CFE49_08510 [Pseudomonas sp. PGPPP3]|nr:MAG: hypothetical protein CFE49_08510 [Pseudomonas sp. PGPPP3]